MSTPDTSRTPRPRSGWGPLRAVAGFMAFALLANAGPGGRSIRITPTAVAGGPSSAVKNYKLDDVVDSRSKGQSAARLERHRHARAWCGVAAAWFSRFARIGKTRHHQRCRARSAERVAHATRRGIRACSSVHDDRPVFTHNYRTSVTVGARAVQDLLGFTGAGVGLAVIDSGVTSWHDDLIELERRQLSVRQSARHQVRRLRKRPLAAD